MWIKENCNTIKRREKKEIIRRKRKDSKDIIKEEKRKSCLKFSNFFIFEIDTREEEIKFECVFVNVHSTKSSCFVKTTK